MKHSWTKLKKSKPNWNGVLQSSDTSRNKPAYSAKLKERKEKEQERGRKLGSKPPKAPVPGPQANDQANFTDRDSLIMPTASGPSAKKLRTGLVLAYNAQASVDIATMLIIGQHISQNRSDKQEAAPASSVLSRLPDDLGSISRAAANSGYSAKDNTQQFEAAGIEFYLTNGCQHHNPLPEERFAKVPEAPKNAD